MKFSPLQPNLLATGDNSGYIRVFDVRVLDRIECLVENNNHNNSITSLDWNPIKKNILASSACFPDKSLKVQFIVNLYLVYYF